MECCMFSPTDYLEDYIDLVTSIEITAENYKCQYN
jgi:uncharacterized protein (DUF2126 family)